MCRGTDQSSHWILSVVANTLLLLGRDTGHGFDTGNDQSPSQSPAPRTVLHDAKIREGEHTSSCQRMKPARKLHGWWQEAASLCCRRLIIDAEAETVSRSPQIRCTDPLFGLQCPSASLDTVSGGMSGSRARHPCMASGWLHDDRFVQTCSQPKTASMLVWQTTSIFDKSCVLD